MERRKFAKNIALSSLAISATSLQSFGATIDNPFSYSLLNTFSLSGFNDEQEEYPKLVTNGTGESWMFSLRRLPYPQKKEEIACYKLVKGKWQESGTASLIPGEYENPTALCLSGEEPLVAWNRISSGRWEVQVTKYNNGKPANRKNFSAPEGRAVHPKLTAGENGTVWLTWENYYKRKFSVYICKYQKGKWSSPVQLTPENEVCFDPAIVEGKDNNLYLAYGVTDGFHQNIEMRIFNSSTLSLVKHVPVAIGGGLENRVNLNTKPALAFDTKNRLWISWESNRDNSRLQDGDNYTGDRCCSMVCYTGGKIMEQESCGKWLFNGQNDHLPTFINDFNNNLYAFSRCGGVHNENIYWKFRVSRLQSNGWSQPETILTTSQKGQTSIPAVIFDDKNNFWLAWRFEDFITNAEGIKNKETKLNLSYFSTSKIKNDAEDFNIVPAVIEEFHPKYVVTRSGGRHPVNRQKMVYKGEEYTLIVGDLHEHSEGSYCWPAGTDGTLHDDYRYGLYSEGYDFVGITDHTNSMDEPYWRKSLRIADFYTEYDLYIAIPSAEWTRSPQKKYNSIPKGVGHRNVIFSSTNDAEKFIRNGKEIYSEYSPECDSSPKLWQLIREKNIECIAIPHHVNTKSHPCDWSVRDEEIEPVVEIFQGRGNAEYRGCPRENNNHGREMTSDFDETYVDYALKVKGYHIGFIGSGEHNSMGIGLAALWVKEVTRKGIIEALRARRCFGTTGDKIFLIVKINSAFMGEVAKLNGAPEIQIETQGEKEITKVELLRNSKVLKYWKPEDGNKNFTLKYIDEYYTQVNSVLYYYVRITQADGQLAWSSPVFLHMS